MSYTRPYLITVVKKQKGQAIFELLVFLPFLMLFFAILVNVGNAINSSINQQKFTRRYFMYTVKQNSMIPLNTSLNAWFSEEGHEIAGLYSFGFREKRTDDGRGSFAPCFKVPSLGGNDNGETCETIEAGETTTNFIRVYNYFGVCGETFFAVGPNGSPATYRHFPGLEASMNSEVICTFGSGGS